MILVARISKEISTEIKLESGEREVISAPLIVKDPMTVVHAEKALTAD